MTHNFASCIRNSFIKVIATLTALLILTLSFSPLAMAEDSPSKPGAELQCYFYGTGGIAVDGNNLKVGQYSVEVVLKGVANAAVIQVEAKADLSAGVLCDLGVVSTLADADSRFERAAAGFSSDGKLNVILVSNEVSSSSINEGGTVLVTFNVTIKTKNNVDFSDYFTFVSDSDLNFVQPDFESENVFAIEKSNGAAYDVDLLSVDASPEFTGNITITGKVLISQDEYGKSGAFGARGIHFKINNEYVVDSGGNVVSTSSEPGHYGEFSITVPYGTSAITLTGDSTVDRTVNISGVNDIYNTTINVVTVDYNRDTKINSVDFLEFSSALNSLNTLYDLNNDGKVNTVDFLIFNKVLNKHIAYENLYLDS